MNVSLAKTQISVGGSREGKGEKGRGKDSWRSQRGCETDKEILQ